MPTKIPQINSSLFIKSKEQLGSIPFSKTSIRLKAICALENNSISKVSEVFNCSRNSLKSWVRKFSEHGIDGIIDKPKKARKSKLTEDQKLELSKMLSNHQNNWTLKKIQKFMQENHQINISHTGIWKIIKGLNFSYITPRKQHYLHDKKKLNHFKKNSTSNNGES